LGSYSLQLLARLVSDGRQEHELRSRPIAASPSNLRMIQRVVVECQQELVTCGSLRATRQPAPTSAGKLVSFLFSAIPPDGPLAQKGDPRLIPLPPYQPERVGDQIANRLGSGRPVLVIPLMLMRESYFTV